MTLATKQQQQQDQEEGAPALSQEELDAINAIHKAEQDGAQDDGGHEDADGGHDDHHHHSDEFHFYSRPRQRQKWGEAQVLPHTNFNDLFFDLFYVAAAYNLGTLIRASPDALGVLYFFGCFYPIMNIWFQKTFHDAYYDLGNDLFHKVYEFLLLVVLATAVLYIRPVAYLSTPAPNEDMFVFSVCITIGSLMAIGRSVDVILNVDGEPAAKNQGWFNIKIYASMTVFYVAAAVLSAIDHFGSSSSDSYSSTTTGSYDTNSTGTYDNSTATAANETRRFLAGGGDYGDVNHLPIILLLAGSLMYIVGIILLVFRSDFDKNFDPKKMAVPMNIGFFIHRFGEWIMLMLGESVLSLLIVPTQQGDFYKAFFCGILSITVLEVLHFRSQPHEADGHALRRSRRGGVIFIAFGQLYSAALIVLGTSYKMILFEFVFAKEAGEAHRLLRDAGYSAHEIANDADLQRYLAANEPPIDDLEVRQQHVAHYFCISMATVWLCLDVMLVAHKGIEFNMMRCSDNNSQNKNQQKLALGMVFIRGSLILLFATMGFYITEPTLLSFLGLLGIIVQVGLRLGGSKAFDESPFDSSRVPKCSNNFNGPKALCAVSLRLEQITGKKLISCSGKKVPT